MAPLIPRIESTKVGSKSHVGYLIQSGSDFRGDTVRESEFFLINYKRMAWDAAVGNACTNIHS